MVLFLLSCLDIYRQGFRDAELVYLHPALHYDIHTVAQFHLACGRNPVPEHLYPGLLRLFRYFRHGECFRHDLEDHRFSRQVVGRKQACRVRNPECYVYLIVPVLVRDQFETELLRPADKLSKRLITRNIQLLLDYCMRFYDRQFATREKSDKDVLSKFEHLLDDYFYSGKTQISGIPTVRYFADNVFLSPNYFGDLIKKATGKTAQEYIQNKLIDLAKELIAGTNKSISEIAYELGFQYSQHFNRVFKKNVGKTPNEYRKFLQ